MTVNCISQPGTYSLGNIDCAGYNTGTGNYFNFTIPVSISSDLSVTAVTASGFTIRTADGSTTHTAALTVNNVGKGFLRVSHVYSTSQTANVMGVCSGNFTITVS